MLYLFTSFLDLALIVIEQLAEALEVYYLSLAQELDDFVDIGIVGKPKNVVVGRSRFLLCCQ